MRLLQPHTRTYSTHVLIQKVFSNMKRVIKGYSGEDTPLFASMITASETSPSRITSSPSLSPQHTPFIAPSTSQPSNIHTTPVTEEAASMPHESPLQSRRNKGRLSLHELTVLFTNLSNKEKISDDTEVLLEEEETVELVEEPTELLEDQGSGEKGEQEVTTDDTEPNTASVPISIASATPEVCTATANLKSKKQLEQERLSHEEAIKLQEQIDEEERKRIARDAEIAK
ncbi:hypothetical protein Tco_0997513 [Tanacetum coccineum]